MRIFIAIVNCAAVGYFALPFSIDQTESFATREMVAVEPQCTKTCQGDFPVSSNRKYAEVREANHSWKS